MGDVEMRSNALRASRLAAPLAAACGILAVVGVSISTPPHLGGDKVQARGADSTTVEAAVIDALVVHQQAYASASQAKAHAPALREPATALRMQNGAPPATTLSSPASRATKVAQMGARFAGAAATNEMRVVDAVEQANQDPAFKSLDGGVSQVAIRSLKIEGQHARVEALAAMWASMAQKQPDGSWVVATPQNKLVVSLGLDLTANGKWMVSAFTWKFAPGSEP
jgi:ketopantoate reductase